jgi:hypothetical protein
MLERKPVGMTRDLLVDKIREVLVDHHLEGEHLTRVVYEIMSSVEEYVDREVALDNIELAEELTERAARFAGSYREDSHEASWKRLEEKIYGPIQGTLF